MAPMPRVLGIVMAGGRGDRLQPLTRSRSKAAVPFGARHRIIDYVLSNLVNSGIYALYVLVQYKSQSLIEHVSGTWRIGGRLPETFVTVVPPQMRGGETWYRGTADAVFQNLNLIRDFGPELVAVFGADHVYRMDLRHMIQFHLASRADVSVAARPVPLAEASEFGIITTGADGRINAFAEKPRSPEPMPGDPTSALGSMGNHVFATEVLVDVRVAPGAIVAGSIVMDHTEIGPGARVMRAVVDRYNTVPARARLEPGSEDTAGLEVHRDPSGIVVVPRGEPAGPLPQAI